MSLFTSKTCRFWLLKPSFIATSFAWYFKIKKWTNNLRQNSQLFTPRVNSVYHWTESISFLEPKIWDLVPNELKIYIRKLAAFKKPIKNGHQRHALADFSKLTLVMSDLFEKRARWLIFPTKILLAWNV